MRTSNWRYTEWVRFNGAKLSPDFSVLNATELYQHSGPDTSDFGASENENVANDPHNAATKASLSAALAMAAAIWLLIQSAEVPSIWQPSGTSQKSLRRLHAIAKHIIRLRA